MNEKRNVGSYVMEWAHTKNEDGILLMPPLEILNQLFTYDPETGDFFRKYSIKHGDIEPRKVEANNGKGYYIVRFTDSSGKVANYKVHRICYYMGSGTDPLDNQIDHINGAKTDNRFSNLRVVTNAINGRNQKMRNDNTSGITGVYWDKGHNKWTARIFINGKNKNLGRYNSLEDAIAAREAAIIEFNRNNPLEQYTDRHGLELAA